MRTLRLAVLFFASLPMVAAAGTPLDTRHKRETITMDYLMESCTVVGETAGGMVPHFDCESYLYGLLDAQLAVRGVLAQKHAACFPEGIAPWEVYQELGALVRRDDWDKPAAPFVLEALKKRFPCA